MVGDEPIAAVAFERLGDKLRRPLAGPVLRNRRCDTRQHGLRSIGLGVIERLRKPHAHPHQRLALYSEVSDNIAHDRQIDQAALEGAPVAGVVDRLGQSLPHQSGRADCEVESRQVCHLDDGADTAPLLAQHDGMEPVELDLAAGIRLVAALVFKPLQLEPVAAAVGEPSGRQEAGQALVSLRQSQEQVAHRHREEPLVSGEEIGCAGASSR